jgi:hypothetical protein
LSAKVALLGYGGIEGVDGFPGLLGAMMKKEEQILGADEADNCVD